MEDFQFRTLSPDQRIAKQRELRNKGLYAGALDGKLGEATIRALAMDRMMEKQAPQGDPVRLRELEMQAAREQRAAEIQKQRSNLSNPLIDTMLPFAAGLGGGYLSGELVGGAINRYDRGEANALAEIGDEIGPTRKLTTSQLNRSRAMGAARAADRFTPRSPVAKAARTLGRAGSYALPAGGAFYEYQQWQQAADDETLPPNERLAAQRIARGWLGVINGLAFDAGKNVFFPAQPKGLGRAEMRIQTARDLAERTDEANAARLARSAPVDEGAAVARLAPSEPLAPMLRTPPQPVQPALPAPVAEQVIAPEAAALTETATAAPRTHGERLISAAKIGGASNIKTKKQAAQWLSRNVATLPSSVRSQIASELGVTRGPNFVGRMKNTVSEIASKSGKFGILAPLAGAAVGWEMAGDNAQASTGDASGGSELRRRAEGAAIGGGATAGTMYGLRQLAQTPLGRAATRIGGRAMYGANLPFDAYAQMTETDPERQPFTRRASAVGESGGSVPMMAANVLQSEFGSAAQEMAPQYMERGRQLLARNLPMGMQNEAVRAAGAREALGMTPEQTDAAFEQALAQFEAMNQARNSEPAMSPLQRMMSAPSAPAQMMAQNAAKGWR